MKRERNSRPAGLGIGYVSIMIIFAVIGLTLLAVLSFQAAGAGSGLSEKSAEFTAEYYAADSEAKRVLSELDAAAAEAGLFFEEGFSEAAKEVCPEVKTAAVPEGVRADYSVVINERQTLFVSVTFFSDPQSERFRVDRWQSRADSGEEDEGHLNVWDGTFN